MLENLNIALPGLQELAAPVSDAMRPVIILPPHTQGDPWGLPLLAPFEAEGQPPETQAASGELWFHPFSDQTQEPYLVVPVVVLDPAEWTFAVAEVPGETFNLTPGLWWWVLWETSGDEAIEVTSGQLTVRHAVA